MQVKPAPFRPQPMVDPVIRVNWTPADTPVLFLYFDGPNNSYIVKYKLNTSEDLFEVMNRIARDFQDSGSQGIPIELTIYDRDVFIEQDSEVISKLVYPNFYDPEKREKYFRFIMNRGLFSFYHWMASKYRVKDL